jgi:hypothetical protein
MTHSQDLHSDELGYSVEARVVFSSEDKQRLQVAQNQGVSHYLSDFDFSEKNFVPQISSSINQLGKQLRLSQPLNFNSKSLKAVERALYNLYIKGQNLTKKEIFVPLVAYLGQMVIHIYGGNWHFDLVDDGKTWMPSIVNKYGWKHSFVDALYSYFISDGYYIEEYRAIDLRSSVYIAGTATIKADILPMPVVQTLISQPGVFIDENLTKPEYNRYIYTLPDGRVLIRFTDKGYLYKSRKSFERMHKNMR